MTAVTRVKAADPVSVAAAFWDLVLADEDFLAQQFHAVLSAGGWSPTARVPGFGAPLLPIRPERAEDGAGRHWQLTARTRYSLPGGRQRSPPVRR